jgi:hypothetical protein
MTTQFPGIRDLQPAIILATVGYACVDHRWPGLAAVFVALQLGAMLALRWRRHLRARCNVRFVGRAAVSPLDAPPMLRGRRVHLRLVR